RFTILNFRFCTKAVGQLLPADHGRPPACCRHQRWLCSLAPSPKARKGEPLVAAGVRLVRVLEPPAQPQNLQALCNSVIDVSKLNPGPSGEDADAVGQPCDVGSPCASAR